MEYAEYVLYLLVQILFFFVAFSPIGQVYLMQDAKSFVAYKLVAGVVQSLCLIASIVLMFISKKAMCIVVVSSMFLTFAVEACFEIYAKKLFFNKLKQKLQDENLFASSALEIRNHLLKEDGWAVTIQDVEQCISKIKK